MVESNVLCVHRCLRLVQHNHKTCICINLMHLCRRLLHIRGRRMHICMKLLHICVRHTHVCIRCLRLREGVRMYLLMHTCICLRHTCIRSMHICTSFMRICQVLTHASLVTFATVATRPWRTLETKNEEGFHFTPS